MKEHYRFILFFILGFLVMNLIGCTNTPSGAFETKTTIYYLDGKFHEDIPEDYIFKTWGYRIEDAIGKEHTYRNKVRVPHGRKETMWCTIHRQSEVIKAHYDPKGDGYFYWVSRHKKSL